MSAVVEVSNSARLLNEEVFLTSSEYASNRPEEDDTEAELDNQNNCTIIAGELNSRPETYLLCTLICLR